MSRLTSLLLLLLLALPAAATAGDVVDHEATMLGWWTFEQEPQDRLEYNQARLKLAGDPSDEDARWEVAHFEEEGATRLRVEKGRASAVGPDGEEEAIDYEIVSRDAEGLTLSGREHKDDSPEVFRVTFGPAGRMLWSHVDHDDQLHFRRFVDTTSMVGEWGLALSGAELEELAAARRELEQNPDDASAAMMVEMMESMLEAMRLTVTESSMALSFGDEAEHVTYTARMRGGRLEVTTTDKDKDVEVMFVVFENDGTMAWSMEDKDDVIRFARK